MAADWTDFAGLDLDRTLGDIDAARDKFDRLVLPPLGGEREPAESDPRTHQAELDDQRGAQTINLLRLLGYLAEPGPGEGPQCCPT
jgi:hypothetical protein